MKLEDEIKQKQFANNYHRLALNIMFTSSWLETIHGRGLRKYGITTQQYNVLRILRGQSPNAATVGLIQERMLDKNSNASRLIDKLLLKKLVSRKICPEDRRQMDVKITKKGLDLLTELDQFQTEWTNSLKTISEAEAKLVSDLLDKLRG
ncbi:MAG TPA: MarR family transcriptional regulator [Bacteroidia bacterium]|jgi:DNA-binding MarR family transcriptional regulator|nr:MarR family transcriptional regulator [Bacteroidia bacterium]